MAVNSNATQPTIASRAKGGLLLGAAEPTPPGRVVKAVRKVLPLSAAMYLQNMAGSKALLTNADLSGP